MKEKRRGGGADFSAVSVDQLRQPCVVGWMEILSASTSQNHFDGFPDKWWVNFTMFP